MIRIGLISDTHGLLRPEAVAFLRGSDHIIHAGDIGDEAVLGQLQDLAPLTAVRGNVDTGAWAKRIAETAILEVAGMAIHVLHDLSTLAVDPATAGYAAVVAGHSHVPKIERRAGVWVVNPGSAGPRRFRLPVSVGELLIDSNGLEARLADLPVGTTPPKKKLSKQ
jgi:putative phosphoesterase